MIKVGSKETMTVAELREHLATLPQDWPIFAAWEGVRASIRPEKFFSESDGGDMTICVDVENYLL